MAAALRQYQACVGIMLRLQVHDLTLLKQDFDHQGHGLSLEQFVSIMLDRVSWDLDNVVLFIEDLIELFAQVDVNGDCQMEWEEFTSAIIEGGMASMNDEMDWRDLRYEEQTEFIDQLNRPPRRIQYLQECKRILIYENTRPVIEIVDPLPFLSMTEENEGMNSIPMISILHRFHPLSYIHGYRHEQDQVRSERSPVQVVKYLDMIELIVVSSGDLKLTFWSSTIFTASTMEGSIPLAIVHTPRPQRVLEWNRETKHLYSISADLIISIWSIVREKHHDIKGICQVSLVTTLKQHTDLLQDLLLVNQETLVSCGMDNMIYLWDPITLQVRGHRSGHQRGIRILKKLSNQIFLSAGFECEIWGWDVGTLATTPVFKLGGHTSPVCCIELIQSCSGEKDRMITGLMGDQAITVDDEGWFKWWNLNHLVSTDNVQTNTSRCLQTLRLGSEKYPWKAHSLAILNNGQTIIAAGAHKLKVLQRLRLKPRIVPSTIVLYNTVSFTLLTTTDRAIRIWDASSGTVVRTYNNITTSDITCVDLDARQRKIIVGTQRGDLMILNYLNGALLKTWTPHQLHVSAIIYCQQDQCVLTCSWDRSLRLYDDNASNNTLLRCITDAHDTDIKCMAYCYAMGIVATGSVDGVIKIWDYIYFLLEDTCLTSEYRPLVLSGVMTLEFMEPYPLLLSGHENGTLCCWLLTTTHASTLLFYYAPFLGDPTTRIVLDQHQSHTRHGRRLSMVHGDESRGGITACQVYYDATSGDVLMEEIRRGRFLVVVASIDGEMSIDDFSHAISLSHVKALSSTQAHGYHPRRRFIRHGKTAKRHKKHIHPQHISQHEALEGETLHGIPTVRPTDVVHIRRWKAHEGSVRSLRIVEDPPSLLSCSSDKSVKVWDLNGQCLGHLIGTQQIKPSASVTVDLQESKPIESDTESNWLWDIDTESAALAKRVQAEAVWEKMKADKLKLLEQRHSSVLGIVRKKPTLKPSASAPVLTSGPKEETSRVETDTNRLFQQLNGQITWRQSDIQLARQAAWERERAKFHVRMKRIMRKRGQSISNNESDESTDTLLPMTLTTASQALPFHDPENWAIGSLNREKQMYSHFHHENIRRQVKQGRSQPLETLDLTPSPFLLQQLGPSCTIQQQTRAKRKKKIRSTSISVPQLSVPKPDSGSELLPVTSSTSMRDLNEIARHDTTQHPCDKKETSSHATMQHSCDKQTLSHDATQHSCDKETLSHDATQHSCDKETLSHDATQHSCDKKETLSQDATQHPCKTEFSRRRHSYHGNLKESTPVQVKPERRKVREKPIEHRVKSIEGLKPSTTIEKKQRIRSETQLLRQEYFGIYPREDILNVYRTFQKLDKDHSGTITLRELMEGANLFGSIHLQENIMSIFSSIDTDQSGHIDLIELFGAIFHHVDPTEIQEMLRFCKIIQQAEKTNVRNKKQLTLEQLTDIKALFQLYDTDRNGGIDADELFTALQYNTKFYDEQDRIHITKQDVERIIARFDKDTTMTLDLQEFIELFRDEL